MLRALIIILSLSFMAFGSENRGVLLFKLRQELKKASPFKADFIQKVMDGDEVLDEASGELIYSNPFLFRLNYTKPEYKVALFKKNSYLFYDEENEQVTTTKNIKERKDFLWKFIFSDSMKKYITTDEKTKSIRILKRDENTDITVFIGKNGMPEKVVNENGGNTNVYIFSNYRKGIKIAGGEFEFTFPEGVEIIEM